VKSGLKHDHITLINEIDKSMLLVNPPRPTTFKDVSKRLRFANSISRVTQDILEKPIYSLQSHFVVGLPMAVVLPAERSKNQTHQDRSCSST
jgi:hypothetical protein